MRDSGILMHITSLPGAYGVGTLGKEARAFVDFLHEAGQRCWQLLPVGPTGYGNSPYQSCSSFAGNPYLVDPEVLAEEGLLSPEELQEAVAPAGERVDFGWLYQTREGLLRKAFARFVPDESYRAFCTEASGWLPDYALYQALKTKFGGKAWYDWEEGLKFREPEAIWSARRELAEEIRLHSFVQYRFFLQWEALHRYATEKGICLIGDLPIYVPLDSVEVWTDPELYQLDETRTPTAVAGCPPDAFTSDGQLWGNPLYRWDAMEQRGFAWWIRRLDAAGKRFDRIRFDHFRGLESYWAVPWGEKTARNGRWVKGPGHKLVEAVKKSLPGLSVIAEDLGYMTEEVLELQRASGWPGMKVLQFAFDSREPSDYLPHSYTPDSVCYTGTHDNVTMGQWLETAASEAVAYAREYLCLTEAEGLVRGCVRAAMASVSCLCVIPMQDWLALGGEARMNFPGTLSDSNWTWRIKDGIITDNLAKEIRRMTTLYGRNVSTR